MGTSPSRSSRSQPWSRPSASGPHGPGGGLLQLLGRAIDRMLSTPEGQVEQGRRGLLAQGLSSALVAIDSIFKDGDFRN